MSKIRSLKTVGKLMTILLLLTTAYVLLFRNVYSGKKQEKQQLNSLNTSYVLSHPSGKNETFPEDIRSPAHDSATFRAAMPLSSTTAHTIVRTVPHSLCSEQCVPCSNRFSSCRKVIATEPRMRPKHQYNTRARKVMLSTDVKNLYFTWFVPIVSLLWYEKMGWQPVLLIVYISEEHFTPQINLIIKYAIASGIEVHKYKHTLDTSKYPMMVTVTSIRFAACVLDWPEDMYVLTSDVDMWPLNSDFYNNETSYNTAVHILYANGYGDPKSAKEYPACYIGMNISTWREVMKCHKGQDMMSFLAELRNFAGGSPWGIDQRGFTMRLKNWKGFPNNVHFTSRNIIIDRIGRKKDKDNFVWTPQKVEAHVLRPPFTPQNWPRLRAVLSHVLNQEEMEWIDVYTEHICSLLFCINASVNDSSNGIYRYQRLL